MPQVAIADTARVVATQSYGLEQLINVWHVRDQIPGTPSVASQVMEAFRIFYVGLSTATTPNRGLGVSMSADWRLEQVSYQRITSVPYPDPTVLTVGTAGPTTGEGLPLQVALCVGLRTGVAGRRGRGRVFLGGFTEADNTEGTDAAARPVASLITRVSAALADLDDNLNTAGGALAVVSELDEVSRTVQTCRIANKWATQRRRQADVPVTAVTTVSMLEA